MTKTTGTILRNKETIERYKQLAKPAAGPHPLLQYFLILLESGKLNMIESYEICSLVLSQNKKQFVEKWLNDGKLELTYQLGDLVKQHDQVLAQKIYQNSNPSQNFE